MSLDKPWGARYRPSYSLENFLSEALCTSVLLYAKMLTEAETEETIGFFVTFLSTVAFLLVAWAPGPPPWLHL